MDTEFIWHDLKVRPLGLVRQPLFIWDGKKSTPCVKHSWKLLIFENDASIELNDGVLEHYGYTHWCYVDQKLELRPKRD